MPRPSVGEEPMTGAERQARYRAAHAAGAPVVRIRRPADRRSRIQRWNDTIAAAVELQAEYADWLEALPDNQQDSALAEALRAIVELDLSELQGWRRDVTERKAPKKKPFAQRSRLHAQHRTGRRFPRAPQGDPSEPSPKATWTAPRCGSRGTGRSGSNRSCRGSTPPVRGGTPHDLHDAPLAVRPRPACDLGRDLGPGRRAFRAAARCSFRASRLLHACARPVLAEYRRTERDLRAPRRKRRSRVRPRDARRAGSLRGTGARRRGARPRTDAGRALRPGRRARDHPARHAATRPVSTSEGRLPPRRRRVGEHDRDPARNRHRHRFRPE